MYLALFLTPWVLMYTASTFVMNHREWFRELYGGSTPSPVVEREMRYEASFPESASTKQMARQILASLDLDGAFNVSQRARDGAIVIQRLDPITPRRVTYDAAQAKLTIEKMPWESRAFLERMHRRRGYQQSYALDIAWASSVDFFIAAMTFWVLSGLWMWWELRATRAPGACFAVAGAVLFAFFVVAI